jgi:hypothetical protein
MLENQGKDSDVFCLLPTKIAANTEEATGGWIPIANSVGDLVVLCNIGSVTGSITPLIQTAIDDLGTGGVEMTANEYGSFESVTAETSPRLQKRLYDARSSLSFIRFVGTIETGPASVGASLQARPKYL